MKNETWEIDITPSWRFTVRGLFAVLESHLKKSLKYKDVCEIREQLLQCGDVADNAVAFSDEIKDFDIIEKAIIILDDNPNIESVSDLIGMNGRQVATELNEFLNKGQENALYRNYNKNE